MQQDIFPETAQRVKEWAEQPGVVGVLLVGSKSRGHADALSDDDLEVLYTDEAHAQFAPKDCIELLITGEGEQRKLIYDAQLTTLSDLQHKASSTLDLDRWPYERARVLLDRDGHTAEAVQAAGRMDPDFRRKRLQHASIDAWTMPYRAQKTIKRDWEAASRLLVARGARALVRVVFALEWRWVPLDHWLDQELKTLEDPEQVGPSIIEALVSGKPEPLQDGLNRLESRLQAEGIPTDRTGRSDLFMELIHPSRADERAVHGLQ